MEKRILSLILSLAMVLSVINVFGLVAFAADADEKYPQTYFEKNDAGSVTLASPNGESVQWQVSDSKDGTYSNVSSGASIVAELDKWYKFEGGLPVQVLEFEKVSSEYLLGGLPVKGYSGYACQHKLYVSNGSMAYHVDSSEAYFDVIGLYDYNGDKVWISTSYDNRWDVFAVADKSDYLNAPYVLDDGNAEERRGEGSDYIDSIALSFDSKNEQIVNVALTTKEGYDYIAFDTDVALAHYTITAFADTAALDIIQNSKCMPHTKC